MKPAANFIPLTLVLLFAGTLCFDARGQDNAAERPDMEARLKQFLERFPEADANKDGTLTREEVSAFQVKRRGDEPAARGERQAGTAPTHADVSYGDHQQQKFDIWLAESTDGKPTPLIIHIHGGGFRGGDKRVGPGTAERFLKEGISFASINYRLSAVGPYPIMMQDAARCLQSIRHRAAEWNLDSKQVACYGGSAGAGISLWLGFHDDLAQPDSDDPIARESTRIVAAGTTNGQSTYDMRTFGEWFGVPNLKPHEALVGLYAIEEEADWQSERVQKLMTDASPITHLSNDDVPAYMTYGKGDTPVDENTNPSVWVHHVRLGLKLQQAMQEIGLECSVRSPDHDESEYGSLEAFLISKVKGMKNDAKAPE